MNGFEKDQVSGAVDEPNPLECLHINQGSADAAADAYEAEYVEHVAHTAWNNTYHKVRPEVSFSTWLIIWKKALSALSRAQQAPAVSEKGEIPIAPDRCPITGRKFWGNLDHPELGMVATYGGPYDTYTIPSPDEDGELRCERFDQDRGEWIEGGEPTGKWLADEQPAAAPVSAQQAPDRPCTCHPSDNPPDPCARKYALSECKAAAPVSEQQPGCISDRESGDD
jgi:hypothetical protein